jgi:geranylgeranyl transferase type-2 subunit alpha
LTTRLLKRNPEYYTIWNFRRLILKNQYLGADGPPGDGGLEATIATALTGELSFLVPLLLQFPKCYWIWNHRRWLLGQATSLLPAAAARPFWANELALATKMLARDNRNFHGWGYRRAIVAALEGAALSPTGEGTSMAREEYDYADRMFRTDLSNFSALHARSKLIPRLLAEKGAGIAERKERLEDELEMILEAIYTDPADQSIWFYYAYLITAFTPEYAHLSIAPGLSNAERLSYTESEIAKLLDLLQEEKDSKWVYQSLIQLATSYGAVAEGQWPERAGKENLRIWMGELRRLDPLRLGRWADMERNMNLKD